MAGLMCGNTQCGQLLGNDDVYCGSCGMPVPRPQHAMSWPGTGHQDGGTPSGQPDAELFPTGTGVPFFGHEPRHRPRPLNDATRYLCAAAYLDDHFGRRVIRELVATRRAVAPSLNVDIGPVIWHCQRARRNLLIRNIALAAIVLLGFLLDAPAAIVFLFYTVLLGWLLPRAKWKQRGGADKLLYVLGVLAVVAIFGFGLLGIFVNAFTSAFGTGGSLAGSAQSAAGNGGEITGIFFLLLVLTWGTEFAYRFIHGGGRPVGKHNAIRHR